ncbi:OB-fold protein [Lacibacter sp.]|uniref:OB-fold protein n=1 Tax=Lacibacter sp. TaxID=1915409 RepID=UPI002B4AF7C4|nr:hypothetical protein [Lacibacter sp.]HLP39482.1 hypothetical protein [Lacibacter sp.]
MKKSVKIVLLAVLVLVVFAGLYATKEYNRTYSSAEKLKPAYTYDAIELVKEFETDESTANRNLNDQVIAVRGSISKIELNDTTQTLLLGGHPFSGAVLCQFSPGYERELAKLKEGDTVMVKGICTGMLMDVILIRCAFHKP